MRDCADQQIICIHVYLLCNSGTCGWYEQHSQLSLMARANNFSGPLPRSGWTKSPLHLFACLLAVVPLHHAIAHVSHRAQTSSQRRRISFEGKNLKLHWKLQLSPVPCCLCYIVIRLFFLSPPLLLDVYFQKVKMRQLNATIFTCLAAQNNSNIKITFALHLFDPARAPLLKPCTV